MKSKLVWISIAALAWIAALVAPPGRCEYAWYAFGLDAETCPDGAVRQTGLLHAINLARGRPGAVQLEVTAHYTIDAADVAQSAPLSGVRVTELALVGADKVARPLSVERWEAVHGGKRAQVVLPEVPDGDYQLRARFVTAVGADEVALALPLYTPARIHVITDRPLYEPGNTVRFRAVALRARDLAPLDHRPGVWTVRDPDGEVLLEEAAPAGAWGVVAGSFPLDKAARSGQWKVAWRSDSAVDEVAFTVEPFTLPRFRVDAVADRPFYQAGDRPRVRGAVLYASGAPVGGASVALTWRVAGGWPPPTTWLAGALPRTAQTAANGRFELALPEVPADLQGQATLTAQVAAVDAAGDRAIGAVSVLLSEDAIAASAVTELADGLVESFNNRLYVRVATPDGRVVANTDVTVRRAWDGNDRGVTARLDEDGVASLQLDPGAPVNIVIPAAPYRPAPPPPPVTRGEVRELISGRGAALADQVALDRWLAPLAACGHWVDGPGALAQLAVRIDPAGRVVAAGGGGGALERCVAEVARAQILPSGGERLYAIDLRFADADLPRIATSVAGAYGAPYGLEAELRERARAARRCVPMSQGRLARVLTWRSRAGARDVELTGWVADPNATGGEAAQACVARVLPARLTLPEPAPADAMGVARFAVALTGAAAAPRPQPTTMLGYELAISVEGPGKRSTRLRIAPGSVPPLRLRVTPVIANPGERVVAELIRGPSFTGDLPKNVSVSCARGYHEGVELDAQRRATLPIGSSVEGWCTVVAPGSGARARLFVTPRASLAVTVVPKQDRYRPGERAELAIQTKLGGVGGPAAVGLFGVDESLAQLAPLPGPDALARIRPLVTTASPAFGVLDGQALALGRIRGANAAAATVLRVSEVPEVQDVDAVVSGHARTAFDPIAELTDRFYVVLGELNAQVRAWEATAPPGEKMVPATLARLWDASLAACAARGERVDDAYGRRLKLWRLPADLLALTDPRAVVVAATRLPEDVENWPAWVAREKP